MAHSVQKRRNALKSKNECIFQNECCTGWCKQTCSNLTSIVWSFALTRLENLSKTIIFNKSSIRKQLMQTVIIGYHVLEGKAIDLIILLSLLGKSLTLQLYTQQKNESFGLLSCNKQKQCEYVCKWKVTLQGYMLVPYGFSCTTKTNADIF